MYDYICAALWSELSIDLSQEVYCMTTLCYFVVRFINRIVLRCLLYDYIGAAVKSCKIKPTRG